MGLRAETHPCCECFPSVCKLSDRDPLPKSSARSREDFGRFVFQIFTVGRCALKTGNPAAGLEKFKATIGPQTPTWTRSGRERSEALRFTECPEDLCATPILASSNVNNGRRRSAQRLHARIAPPHSRRSILGGATPITQVALRPTGVPAGCRLGRRSPHYRTRLHGCSVQRWVTSLLSPSKDSPFALVYTESRVGTRVGDLHERALSSSNRFPA